MEAPTKAATNCNDAIPIAASDLDQLRDDQLLITRIFDAPRALVFHVWRQPEHVRHWLAPGEYHCASLDWDFRPGGAWRACIRSAENEHWMGGRFVEIVPDERIVMAFAWESADPAIARENRITITFASIGERTEQRFHQAPFDTVERRDSHLKGWTSVVERTGGYVERLAREAS
jgi:uncharacterized protein YndB with AHSA1/START domain